MSNQKMPQAKQVLLEAMAQFRARFPDADVDKKSEFGELCNQQQALKKQNREIQIKTKVISRKIGEAKKNNQPATELIQVMQAQSAEAKQLEAALESIENKILDFFASSDTSEPHNKKARVLAANQRYPSAVDNADRITIALLDKEDREWDDYVAKHPAASIHHRSQWRDVLKKTYSIESFYFFARNEQQKIVGVLPLVRLSSRLFGDLLVSMPYFQRAGAIADHPSIETALMQAANEQAAQLGIGHIEYRDDILREWLPSQSNKVNMVLALPGSEEALWQGFSAKLRAQIKRPQQLAPEVLIGGKEYLDDFYKVYSRNMRDLGSPSHSRRLVENILDRFPGSSWLIVIRMNNRPVSAGLLLGHGDTMEIPLASTIRSANPHSMNMLLYWEVLKLAIRQGYNQFDFGRSSKEAGTYRFKQQWGAQPKQLYWHYWLFNSKQLPALNAANPKYALIIYLWKKLPVRLTQWLGPLIVKNIP